MHHLNISLLNFTNPSRGSRTICMSKYDRNMVQIYKQHQKLDSLFINLNVSCSLEMQVLFPLLELCQSFSTSRYTNLTIWIIWRLEYALSFSPREETNLRMWTKELIRKVLQDQKIICNALCKNAACIWKCRKKNVCQQTFLVLPLVVWNCCQAFCRLFWATSSCSIRTFDLKACIFLRLADFCRYIMIRKRIIGVLHILGIIN